MEKDQQNPGPSTSTSIEARSSQGLQLSEETETMPFKPRVLSEEMLPTEGDVLRYVIYLRNEHHTRTNKNELLKSFAEAATDTIINIWKHTNVPLISHKGIRNKVANSIEKYKYFTKNNKTYDYIKYMFSLESLFDVAICKCDIINSHCKCKQIEHRIPIHAKAFMIDQRTERKMKIQPVILPMGSPFFSSTSDVVESENVTSEYIPSTYEMDCASVNVESSQSSSARSDALKSMRNTSMECDRYGVSDRAASAIATALIKDLCESNLMEQPIIIDRSKIRREREKSRQYILTQREDSSILRAFSFDSRTDKTFAPIVIDGRQHPRTISETHIVILKQPNTIFLGHTVSPPNSSASQKANILLEFFQNKKIKLNNLFAVCCDGEPVNTGRWDGVLRNLEKQLKMPIHWFICLLHFNELPLRHLFEKIDGSTTGPKSSSGPIGKAIGDCESKQVRK